jgi:large subunit ribosomal protein L22
VEAKATAKFVRVSSRKAKLVADLVRGKDLEETLAILALTPTKAARIIEKVVISAAANAENNHDMDVSSLYIAEIYANQGPTMKRFQPRAQGRAGAIRKRTSHITAVLKEKE